ncbi:MAG: TetR/AcrR family transcriptional regulator [Actinomycetota bacterium]|nr:TetR/AcrR family transcriptional regulator [Actinomycetota bacterium]
MSGSRARVLDSAFSCVVRFGLTKTTVDDVARRARLSRATFYRLFPGGREELVAALVSREVGGLFDRLERRLGRVAPGEDAAVAFLTAIADEVVDHPALRTVLAEEPELVLPYVIFPGLDRVLATFADFLAPYVAPALEPEDARRAGEWLARLALSYIACPSVPERPSPPAHAGERAAGERVAGERVAGDDQPGESSVLGPFALRPSRIAEARARFLVRNFVLPGIDTLMAATAARSAGEAAAASPVSAVSSPEVPA